MGSKISNSWVRVFGSNQLIKFLLLIVFFAGINSNIQVNAQSSTQIINDCVITPNVRVAISNNGFKSFVYNQVTIVSTAEYTVYDKKTSMPLLKFLPTDKLKITVANGEIVLNVNNKDVAKNNGVIVIDTPKGLLGVDKLTRGGKQALYHGVFEVVPKNGNTFYLINTLDLQSYLRGVVPNEMPVIFGLEALKAQAVAARNYVLLPRTKSSNYFDVDDSVASQVYFGANTEKPLATKAVNETEGLVALYGWDLILAQYCSTAGGYTESYENAFSDPRSREFPAKPKPYLKGRPDIYSVVPLNREEEARLYYMSYPDSYDMKSPYYRWKKEFTREELEGVLTKTLVDQSKTGFVKPEFKQVDTLGELKELKVLKRGVSGKIIELEIITDKGSWHVNKELVIRRLLQKNGVSLPSANVVFENLYDTNRKLNKVVAYGGGFGHGVGMSQYGAGFMANSLHKNFDKILKRYYTGISISTVPVIISSNDTQKVISQQFFAPAKRAVLVVDNKYNIQEFIANINGKPVAFQLAGNIIPFHRISRIDISSYVVPGKNKITFYFPNQNGQNNGKAIRLYTELVGKDDSEYNF